MLLRLGTGEDPVMAPVEDLESRAELDWSPDGQELAVIGLFGPDNQNELRIYEPDGRLRARVPILESHLDQYGRGGPFVSWSPDGELLAVSGTGSRVPMLFRRTRLAELLASNRPPRDPPIIELVPDAWHPTSTGFAAYQPHGSRAGRGDPLFYDAGARQIDPPAEWDAVEDGRTQAVSWSPDGFLLKVQDSEGLGRLLVDGSWHDLDLGGLPLGCMSWSPTGREIVFRVDRFNPKFYRVQVLGVDSKPLAGELEVELLELLYLARASCPSWATDPTNP